jgi:hypothetical protein
MPSKILMLRLQEKDYKRFKEKKTDYNIKGTSSFVRQLALAKLNKTRVKAKNDPLIKEINLTKAEVNKIGKNWNQIAKAVNTWTTGVINEQLMAELADIKNQLGNINENLKRLKNSENDCEN